MSKRRSSSRAEVSFGDEMSFAKPKDFGKSMRQLLGYLKPYAAVMIVALSLLAVGTVVSVVAPSFVRKLTDEIDVSRFGATIDLGAVGFLGLLLVAMYGCVFVFNYLQAFIMSRCNQNVADNMRSLLSRKINRVPLKYFDGNSYGDVLSRVTNDVDTIAQTLNQSISQFVQGIIMLVGVLIAMFVVSWQLALAAIVTVPAGFALMMISITMSQKHFKAQAEYLGELNGQIEEVYSGANVVKAFNGAHRAEAGFGKVNSKLFVSSYKAQFLSGLMMPLMTFVSNLGYIAICIVGGILFVNGTITSPGVIVAFFIYVRMFQNPLGQVAQAMNSFQSTAAASERVFEFLAVDEVEDESAKAVHTSKVEGAVEFKNVRFGYDEKIIINDFSVKIEAGQKVAIVGPTGAGKTTMVNLLMRFYELNGGEILIDGVPISSMRREDVRAMFGMVLQDTWLFEGTIRENIVYAKQGVSEDEIKSAARAANVHHFIKTMSDGYDTTLDDESSISSGQKQLLTIARAMVQNSPMLILDEATSNVDTRTEQLIQDAMDTLTRGRTSFVIAHRLSTIKNADLILVMKDGDIIEKGNHDELIAQNGFYTDLYNSQFSQG